MVIEMIEESFNEPFKTGPLIDQQGNYAIFDILMKKSMFDYIQKHNLQSKAGQQSKENATLKVDFPAGANKGQPAQTNMPPGDPGAVMIKVSWSARHASREAKFPHGRRSGVDATSSERDDQAALFAQGAGTHRIPRRAQDGRPSAVDLDLVRTQEERARTAGGRWQPGARTLQFLQGRMRSYAVSGESDAADPVGTDV